MKLDKENIEMIKESSNAIAQMYALIALGIAIPFIIIYLFS
jgi:thiol:disulfide interchange protein